MARLLAMAVLVLGLLATGQAAAQGCPWVRGPCAGAEAWRAQPRDAVGAQEALLRGQVDFMTANFLRSAEATAEAFRRNPANLDAALWHIAAMARLGQYPAALVATIERDGTNLTGWPGPVLAWFLGRIDRVAVQDLATDQNSSTVEHYTFSFFYFHVASLAVAAGDLPAAEEALSAILDLGPAADRQVVRAATLELGRIIDLTDSPRRKS